MSPATVINESAKSSQEPCRFVFISHFSFLRLFTDSLFCLFSHLSVLQFLNKLYFAAIKFVILFLKQRKVCFVLFTFFFLSPKPLRVLLRKYFARIVKVQNYFKKQQSHRRRGGWWFTARAHCGPQ